MYGRCLQQLVIDALEHKGKDIRIDLTQSACIVHDDANGDDEHRCERMLNTISQTLEVASLKATYTNVSDSNEQKYIATYRVRDRVISKTAIEEPFLKSGSSIILIPDIPLDIDTVHLQVLTWLSKLRDTLISGQNIVYFRDERCEFQYTALQTSSTLDGLSSLIQDKSTSRRCMSACDVKIPRIGQRLSKLFGDYVPVRIVVITILNCEGVKHNRIQSNVFHNGYPSTSDELIELCRQQIMQFGWHEYGVTLSDGLKMEVEGLKINNLCIFIHTWTEARELSSRKLPVDDVGFNIAWGRAIRDGMKQSLDQIRSSNKQVFCDDPETRQQRQLNRWIPSIAQSIARIMLLVPEEYGTIDIERVALDLTNKIQRLALTTLLSDPTRPDSPITGYWMSDDEYIEVDDDSHLRLGLKGNTQYTALSSDDED